MERIRLDNGRVEAVLPARTAEARRVLVGTRSTPIAAENPNRKVLIIYVVANGPIFISPGIATLSDFQMPTGSVFEYTGAGPITGIVGSGTADVRVWEETA